jgi:uncharacterized protein (TIGR02679 family)
VLGGPELAWIVDRLRRRLEVGLPLGSSLRLENPTPAQTAAFARLVGRYPKGRALVVGIEALATLLDEAGAGTLEEAVAAIGGPIVDRRAAASSDAAAWDAVFRPLARPRDPPAILAPAVVEAWRDDLRRSGLVRRSSGGDLARATLLVSQAAAIAARLPATASVGSGMLLAELASTVTGDAHALDSGEPLGALMMRLVTRLGDTDGTDRRAAWAAVGVELDPLSSSVLVLNVRARGIGPTPGVLAACADVGEPVRLTLRQLRALVAVDGRVYCCENPSVVAAAADRLGASSAPMICTDGQPKAATRALLRLCAGPVWYHGDFDWPGVRIANEVLATTGGVAWRMGPVDYRAAPKGTDLAGPVVPPAWSIELGEAMQEDGRAVHEEAVLEALLGDLARGGALPVAVGADAPDPISSR